MVEIVLNIDSNYVQHCAVTLASAFRNTPTCIIGVHLLCLNVPLESKKMLEEMVIREGHTIHFYDVAPEVIATLPMQSEHYISEATYLRLFLTQYLPTDIHKVLYLDCDLLLRTSLEDLYNTDICDFALAAVEDVLEGNHSKRLNYPQTAGYFNAGVLVVNLDYWRANNAVDQFENYINANYSRIVFHDQDVLNAVFYDKRKILLTEWNVMNPFQPADKVKIIHFAGGIKPWFCRPISHYYREYYHYLSFTPFRGFRTPIGLIIKKRGILRAIANLLGIEYLLRNYILKR